MTRRAILGGTFDPVHCGHLALGQLARDELGFDEVVFVPAGVPYHRHPPVASALHRFAMVRYATSNEPGFVVDDIEVLRQTASYTVDTLENLRLRWGTADSLALLLGLDAFLNFPNWRDPERILQLCHLVVVERPGVTAGGMPAAARSLLAQRQIGHDALLATPAGGIYRARADMPDISATAIRQRLLAGESVDKLLPAAVVDYILREQLYKKVV